MTPMKRRDLFTPVREVHSYDDGYDLQIKGYSDGFVRIWSDGTDMVLDVGEVKGLISFLKTYVSRMYAMQEGIEHD